ncbi:MAG TPA: hypothetical protein VFY69_11680 [Solirubrobacterales bacterium]|nr:hypothetical protein [Solirubrobacterales bacterium]
MKRVGPELKMPDLKQVKVPKFASDLYYDLHDRRLLPLVGLILVAIVATPFLLGSDPETVEAPPPAAGATALEGAQASELTVVEAHPGLRDYRKRLSGRTPTNPFKQRFTGAAKGGQLPNVDSGLTDPESSDGGSGGGSGGGEPAPAPPSSTPVEPAPEPAPAAPGGGGGGEDEDGDGLPDGSTLYTYVLDLEITKIVPKPNGGVEKTGPTRRENVKPPQPLPGAKAPVVTYLGLGAKEPRRPLFLISPDVTAVYGEAECVAGTDICQMIALDPEFPVTLVYGENDVRYKIKLLDITPAPIKPPST